MRTYRRVWAVAVSALAIAGYASATVLLPAAALICIAVIGTALVVGVGTCMSLRAGANEHTLAALPIGLLATACAMGGFTAVSAVGLIALFGVPALLLPLLAGACCPPPLRSAVHRRLLNAASSADGPDPSSAATGATRSGDRATSPWRVRFEPSHQPRSPAISMSRSALPHPEICRQLAIEELCWWWQASFVRLERATCQLHRLNVIETRQAVLDELAARQPASFARWMRSGARVDRDPRDYFSATA